MHLLNTISVFAGVFAAVASALPSANFAITGCALNRATLPKTGGPTDLAGPDPGLRLTRVVLGRGTQNYTCADSKETTVPASAGAIATLYDASCLAEFFPTLLHKLPDAIVTLSTATETFGASAIQQTLGNNIISGHHYFTPDFSTPNFDFRLKPGQKQIFAGKRDQGVPATTTAVKGGSPDQQFGAVDWLRLKAIPEKSIDFKLAYRVHTAGGKAPATCAGQPSIFTIDYAAEYWFYN